MADKKPKETKSQTVKSHTMAATKKGSRLGNYKFRWWHAAILIGVVAVIGLIVLRFSRASSGGQVFPAIGRVVKMSDIRGNLTSFAEYKGDCTAYPQGPARTQCVDNQQRARTIKEIYNSELVTFNCDTDSCAPAGESTRNLFFNGAYCRITLGGSDNVAIWAEFQCADAGITPPSAKPTGQQGGTAAKLNLNDPVQQQIIIYDLSHGFGLAYMKANCNAFTDPPACVVFVQQQYDKLFPGGFVQPPQPTRPVCSGPMNTGCDDGHWIPLTENNAFSRYPDWKDSNGDGYCAAKRADGYYEVNNRDLCKNIVARALCAPYQAAINNAIAKQDPSLLPKDAPAGCIGDLQGALTFVQLIKLNNTAPQGYIDDINGDCSLQYGWAQQPTVPNTPITVNVYVDGNLIANIPANKFRGGDFAKNYGNGGYHGFEFEIPSKFKDKQVHSISAEALGIKVDGKPNGIKFQLINGPKKFSCDYAPQGNLERIDAQVINNVFTCSVTGWAEDPSSPDTAINVDAYIDDVGVVHNAPADQFRADLADPNNHLGNGKHQYRFDIPAQYRDPIKHTLKVYGIGVGEDGKPNGINALVGSKVFQCDYPPTGSVDQVIQKTEGNNLTCTLFGWAYDPSAFYFATTIVAYYDFSDNFRKYDFLDEPFLANLFRDDLLKHDPPYGNGQRGFTYPIPEKYFDGKKHQVYVYARNIDRNGLYIQQNNTFIGSKEIQCPLRKGNMTTNASIVVDKVSTPPVDSGVSKGTNKDTNKPVDVIVTRTPQAYDEEGMAKAVADATKQTSTFKGDKGIPTTIPANLQLAQTQAVGDNGKKLSGTVYIQPSLPTDIGIGKVVIYIDGKNPKLYQSLADATRVLDTTKLSNGVHTVETLAFADGSCVRALQQRILIDNQVNVAVRVFNSVQTFFFGQ